jgi:hypothetical protein
MQFADSAGNIAAGALFRQIHFIIVFSEKTDMKGLLAPFCSSSKRSQIPFCNMQKGIRYRLQNPKNSAKIKEYCMR